jgi:hypothetical protein
MMHHPSHSVNFPSRRSRGEIAFEDLNRLIASHMLWWSVFNAKGIFRESGMARISLRDNGDEP